MKRNIIITVLVLFAMSAKSQQIKADKQKLYEDYLQKSKRQKTTGFILLGVGASAFTAGMIAIEHVDDKGATGAILILSGLTAATTSIPFFLGSAHNRKKARLIMKREAILFLPEIKSGYVQNSIGIKIEL